MSHQDQDGRKVRFNGDYLKKALQWFSCKAAWNSIRFRGDCTWKPLYFAAAAIMRAWSDELTLGERFRTARKITAHLYRPQQEFAVCHCWLVQRCGSGFRRLIVDVVC